MKERPRRQKPLVCCVVDDHCGAAFLAGWNEDTLIFDLDTQCYWTLSVVNVLYRIHTRYVCLRHMRTRVEASCGMERKCAWHP